MLSCFNGFVNKYIKKWGTMHTTLCKLVLLLLMSIGDGFYTALALALHILTTCCLFHVWWCDEITLCLTLESFLNGFYSYVAQAWIIKWVTHCLMRKGIIGICVYCVVESLIFLHVTKCVSRRLYLIC